jgi:hypothetical protein
MDDSLSLVQVGGNGPPPASSAASLFPSCSRFFWGGGRGARGHNHSLSFHFCCGMGTTSLVLVHDHTAICGGQYGAKRINCFYCALLKDNSCCPLRHNEVKHLLFVDDKTPTSAWLYFAHKSRISALFAEPYVDVGEMPSQEYR